MNLSRETEKNLQKLKETIDKYYPEPIDINYEKYLSQTGVFNLFNQNQGCLTIIFDIKHFKIVNISKNIINFTGHNKKEFGENFISLIAPEHISFINVFAAWIITTLRNLSKPYMAEYFLNCWGINVLHKSGEVMKWYLSAFPLELDGTGKPLLVFVSVQDITHLMKGDDYWIRGVFGKEEKKIFVYHSNENKSSEQEIVSEREQEVLKYIIQGLNTKQIASILHISHNTVDNHRRNMLARTGTRDTTALIHLCKMMGII